MEREPQTREEKLEYLRRRMREIEEEDDIESQGFQPDDEIESMIIANLNYFKKRRDDENKATLDVLVKNRKVDELKDIFKLFEDAPVGTKRMFLTRFLKEYPMFKSMNIDVVKVRIQALFDYALSQQDDEARRLYKKLLRYHFKFPDREPLRMPPPLD